MPPAGMKVYEELYGRIAEIELDRAKKAGDVPELAQVAQKYFHTKAGLTANDILATYFLDRGEFFQAALQFDRMLTLSSKQAKLSPLSQFKATIAFRRGRSSLPMRYSNNSCLAASGWWLEDRQADGFSRRAGENSPGTAKPQIINPKDWPLWRGNLSNTAQTLGSQPLLGEVLWKRPTVRDKFDITGDVDPDGGVPVLIKEAAAKTRALTGVPIMPGFFPLAVEGKLLYRNYNGMTAVNLHDIKDDQGKVDEKAGDNAWKGSGFDGGLAKSLSNNDLRDKLNQNVNDFKNGHPVSSLRATRWWERCRLTSSRSTRWTMWPCRSRPQWINSLFNMPNGFNPPVQQISKEIKEKLLQNSLEAYNIQTGKLEWAAAFVVLPSTVILRIVISSGLRRCRSPQNCTC